MQTTLQSKMKAALSVGSLMLKPISSGKHLLFEQFLAVAKAIIASH